MPDDIIARSLVYAAVLIIGLASKPTKYHPLVFILAILTYASILVTPIQEADPATIYQIGNCAVALGVAFEYFVLSDPQRYTHRHGDKEPASTRSFVSRLQWSSALLSNPRGVNWTCAVPNLQYPTYTSRQQFVLSRLAEATYYFVLLDIVSFCARSVTALQYPQYETLGAHGFMWQVLCVMLFWATMHSYMAVVPALASAIAVAMGVSDPEDWPSLFGPMLGTTSIRTFWGKSWHQLFRRSVQPQSKFVAEKMLRLRKGSLVSRYTQLFSCFLLSGLYHSGGEWVVQRNLRNVVDVTAFFVLQAIAISFEDFIIFLGKKIGIKNIPRVISYIWVIVWFGLSSPLWVEKMVQSGVFRAFLMPSGASVIEAMLGQVDLPMIIY